MLVIILIISHHHMDLSLSVIGKIGIISTINFHIRFYLSFMCDNSTIKIVDPMLDLCILCV